MTLAQWSNLFVYASMAIYAMFHLLASRPIGPGIVLMTGRAIFTMQPKAGGAKIINDLNYLAVTGALVIGNPSVAGFTDAFPLMAGRPTQLTWVGSAPDRPGVRLGGLELSLQRLRAGHGPAAPKAPPANVRKAGLAVPRNRGQQRCPR